MMEIFERLLDLVIYILAGVSASYFYYFRKKRDLLFGFWGGVAVGTIGAIMISMIAALEGWFIEVVTWLMKPKFGNDLIFRVNLIAAVFGAFLFLYILNRINHDKERR
ncbi:MAG: hypothetical protein OEZ34_11535 [Spirochaetia bacterium]|nr:hypothetical protein [Spirochaetia bacterium]